MAKKILVTGGAGFIGSHLVRALLEEGWTVHVLDDLSTGAKENLDGVFSEVRFLSGDIRDREMVRKAAKGVVGILHQAALAAVPRSIEDPATTHDVNVTGTLNVLEAARQEDVPRVVLASSSSVYGETPTLPKVETMQPAPISPYASHKFANELYARQYHLHFGVTTVCLRYFNVFGPRQNPEGAYAAVIPRFIHRIQAGQPPIVNGTGEQTRDFTYIENVISANLLALKTRESVGGEAYNVASGDRISIRDLAEKISELLGWKGGIEFGPARPGDIEHSYADIKKASKNFGYKPKVRFEQGLEKTVEWFVR